MKNMKHMKLASQIFVGDFFFRESDGWKEIRDVITTPNAKTLVVIFNDGEELTLDFEEKYLVTSDPPYQSVEVSETFGLHYVPYAPWILVKGKRDFSKCHWSPTRSVKPDWLSHKQWDEVCAQAMKLWQENHEEKGE